MPCITTTAVNHIPIGTTLFIVLLYISKNSISSASAMFTRAALAAIDYNCNLDRTQVILS